MTALAEHTLRQLDQAREVRRRDDCSRAAQLRQAMAAMKLGEGFHVVVPDRQPGARDWLLRINAIAYQLWGSGGYRLKSSPGSVFITRVEPAVASTAPASPACRRKLALLRRALRAGATLVRTGADGSWSLGPCGTQIEAPEARILLADRRLALTPNNDQLPGFPPAMAQTWSVQLRETGHKIAVALSVANRGEAV